MTILVLLYVILWSFSCAVGGAKYPIVLTDSCNVLSRNHAYRYNVQVPNYPPVQVIAKEEEDCSTIIQQSSSRKVAVTFDEPKFTLVQTNDGRYVVNISWIYIANLKRNRVHRGNRIVSLLNVSQCIVDIDGTSMDPACFSFKINASFPREDTSVQVPLHFDCIEIAQNPSPVIQAQVWSLPYNTKNRCPRYIRSCKDPLLCSEKFNFKPKFGDSSRESCSCTNQSIKIWTKKTSGTKNNITIIIQRINAGTYALEVSLYDESNDSVIVYEKDFFQRDFKENLTINAGKFDEHGKYVAMVLVHCSGKMKCLPPVHSNTLTFDSPEAKFNEQGKNENKNWHQYVIAICVAVVSALTVIIFVVWVKRRIKPDSREQTPSSLNNETELDISRPLLQSCHDVKPEKMLLFHPDDRSHSDAVNIFADLMKTLDVAIVGHELNNKDKFENVYDFAEKAGKDISEIIIVVSKCLTLLYKTFKEERRGNDDTFQRVHRQRIDDLPCVVLTLLRNLTVQGKRTFHIHLVSFGYYDFEEFQELSQSFLFQHNTTKYNIVTQSEDGSVNIKQSVIETLIEKITGREELNNTQRESIASFVESDKGCKFKEYVAQMYSLMEDPNWLANALETPACSTESIVPECSTEYIAPDLRESHLQQEHFNAHTNPPIATNHSRSVLLCHHLSNKFEHHVIPVHCKTVHDRKKYKKRNGTQETPDFV